MHEVFFTRSEWLGVDFTDLGIPLDPTAPATPAFYEALYTELARRHSSIDDLPPLWLATKRETASCLANLLDPNERLLSFGAGFGNVEAILMSEFGFHDIHLWDASPPSTQLSAQVHSRFLPGRNWPEVSDLPPFDAIYLAQVMYALPHNDAVRTLARLRRHLSDGGRIIVISGLFEARRSRPAAVVGEQGWGWLRDAECEQSICHEAALHNAQSFVCAGQSVTMAWAN